MMKQDSIYKYEEGQFVKKPEWIVDTNGSNLLEVLSQDGIDSSKTHSIILQMLVKQILRALQNSSNL